MIWYKEDITGQETNGIKQKIVEAFFITVNDINGCILLVVCSCQNSSIWYSDSDLMTHFGLSYHFQITIENGINLSHHYQVTTELSIKSEPA